MLLNTMNAEEFNKLRPYEKWMKWKDQTGIWECKACSIQLEDGPQSPGVFRGDSIHCGNCGYELTKRCNGGLNPFGWVLRDKKNEN